MRKNRLAVILGFTAWLGLLTASQAFPEMQCALSADGSAITVVAAYPVGKFDAQFDLNKNFTCQQACLVRAADSKRFSPFQCQFRLSAGDTEDVVCEQNGGGPGAYVEYRNKEGVCVPR